MTLVTSTVMKNKNNIVILEREDFHILLEILFREGYELYGPTVNNECIIYDRIQKTEDLPIGWKDHQKAGSYRLEKSDEKTLFGYSVGPHSWKKLLHPANERLWEAAADGNGFTINIPQGDDSKRAFIGVRSCELQALSIHDKILAEGPYVNPLYRNRRENVFIVAVNCTRPGGTCFCASMKTGPKAVSGFDLSLTEILESDAHYFTVEAGSASGTEILSNLPTREASQAEIEAAEKIMERSAENMGRTLNIDHIKELLYDNFDNAHWETIAERCLTCGNCTMVCPTCFCVNIEDISGLAGQSAERWSRWDSCYTIDFSYIHGGSIRTSPTARYRQWVMHKLAYWLDQFGTFGCVGCGRCITWCPAGIDITEEAAIFQEKQ